jgi:hypothetical protein
MDPTLKIDAPFHIISSIIFHFNISPWRFPIYFILSVVIFACAVGTYALSQTAIGFKLHGTKVMGYVSDESFSSSRTSSGSVSGGRFVYVTYLDDKGSSYTIKRSLAKPYTRLKVGDAVEVIYPTTQPNLGVVNTWDELYLPLTFFALFLVAFITLFILLLSGRISLSDIDEGGSKLKKNGVEAIATVIKADAKAEILVLNIKEDYRIHNKKKEDCYTFEYTDYMWRPNKKNASIKKGDQFRAYYDAVKKSSKVYVDFGDFSGNNFNIKSFEEEEKMLPEENE